MCLQPTVEDVNGELVPPIGRHFVRKEGHQTGGLLVWGHGLANIPGPEDGPDLDLFKSKKTDGLSLSYCLSALYSPNICSPGAFHSCPLLRVVTVCVVFRVLGSQGWVKSRGSISPFHVVLVCAWLQDNKGIFIFCWVASSLREQQADWWMQSVVDGLGCKVWPCHGCRLDPIRSQHSKQCLEADAGSHW